MAPPHFKKRGGNFGLPATFKCGVCGINKRSSEFSKSQIQKWLDKKRNNGNSTVTPGNIGLTCLAHTTGGKDPLQRARRCHGPCDRVKVVTSFSKTQRNNPEPWCQDCTSWKTEFGGETVPTVEPNGCVMPNEIEGIYDEDGNALSAVRNVADDIYDCESIDFSDFELKNSYEPGYLANSVSDDEPDDLEDLEDQDELASVREEIYRLGGSNRLGGFDREVETQSEYTTAYGGSVAGSTALHDKSATRLTHTYETESSAGASQGYRTAGLGKTDTSTIHGGGRGNARTLDSLHASASAANARRGGGGSVSDFVAHVQEYTYGNTRHSGGKKQGGWYRGDNRKIFNGKKMPVASRVQDRTEAAHDSDSADEM
ncbi:hypothetical protein F5Y17DRAFT_32430 [Xylariaceae sp. FL0594]|nr:hypothetical protein F5Y17DRAFT_32430 [Xylariaceae sp. FL0594]